MQGGVAAAAMADTPTFRFEDVPASEAPAAPAALLNDPAADAFFYAPASAAPQFEVAANTNVEVYDPDVPLAPRPSNVSWPEPQFDFLAALDALYPRPDIKRVGYAFDF